MLAYDVSRLSAREDGRKRDVADAPPRAAGDTYAGTAVRFAVVEYSASIRAERRISPTRAIFSSTSAFASVSVPNWLYLSLDHLLPPGHPNRNDPNFQVTACRFCNEARNRNIYEVGEVP